MTDRQNRMLNQIPAHHAGWRLHFRFAGNVFSPGGCEFWRSATQMKVNQ
jgi:hypothetical protein